MSKTDSESDRRLESFLKEQPSFPKWSISKEERKKAEKALVTTIKAKIRKGEGSKKGKLTIRPTCTIGVIPGYKLSSEKSTAVYSKALEELCRKGLVSEVHWSKRRGKHVIDSIVVLYQGAGFQSCSLAEEAFENESDSAMLCKNRKAFRLLVKNSELPRWVQRWADKAPDNQECVALLVDAYFELLPQGKPIPERTIACYALGDSKLGGSIGGKLADLFQEHCPCLSSALANCSSQDERLGLLGISRLHGTTMVSGPMVVNGENGVVIDVSSSGAYGLGVSDELLGGEGRINLSNAHGCLIVENKACFEFASRLLSDRVVTVYSSGQPSADLISFVRRVDASLPENAARRVWLDIDAPSFCSANRFIKAVPSFRTLMMGDADYKWLQEHFLLRNQRKSDLSSQEHVALDWASYNGLAAGIDESLVAKIDANNSAEQEALIGDYAANALAEVFPPLKKKCSFKKSADSFNLIIIVKHMLCKVFR